MKARFIVIGFFAVSACLGQKAHEYYQELYAAGGLDRMADLYVCFDDDVDLETFFIFGESKLFREYLIEAGTFAKLPKASQAELKKDFLIFRGYVKGVPHPQEDMLYAKDGSWVSDKFWLDKNTPEQVRFDIACETLRYKRSVERIRSDGSALPVVARFGRCEEVASGVRQHGN